MEIWRKINAFKIIIPIITIICFARRFTCNYSIAQHLIFLLKLSRLSLADILLIMTDNFLYILELGVGIESNLNNNSRCKEDEYRPILRDLNIDYLQVRFVNLSTSYIGNFCRSSDSCLEICKCIEIYQHHFNYIITLWSPSS